VDPRLTPDTLLTALQEARNPDGGWGYYPHHDNRLEPTIWASLAIARHVEQAPDLTVLEHWRAKDGWLVEGPAIDPVNYAFNALAGLAFLERPEDIGRAGALGRLLIGAKGIALTQSPALRQDNSLQAWPWIDQTFSWVEPTAWCVLLLKKCHGVVELPGAADRIEVAERLIRDRSCKDGGWNYGSSNVYGQELYPYVPTTAITLLAMQDRRSDPVITRAVHYLAANATTEQSAMALALALIAGTIYGFPLDTVTLALTPAAEFSRTRGNVLGMAMSLYAQSKGPRATAAFTL
jgi:hypothetical protein